MILRHWNICADSWQNRFHTRRCLHCIGTENESNFNYDNVTFATKLVAFATDYTDHTITDAQNLRLACGKIE